MIVSVAGQLSSAEPPTAVIVCNGLGYEVWIPLNDFATLPTIGEQVHLFTHQVIRDDVHMLFGFKSTQERSIFKALIGISGIGPKSALGVMSALSPQDLATTIEQNDVRALSAAPGIGHKSAERIIVELRGNPLLLALPVSSPVLRQARQALEALGYSPAKVRRALTGIDIGELSVPELVSAALQQLGKTGKR